MHHQYDRYSEVNAPVRLRNGLVIKQIFLPAPYP